MLKICNKIKKLYLIISFVIVVLIGITFFVCFDLKNNEKISILFNELDSNVNEGKSYSEYLNTGGFPTGALLAWSESYLMQFYAILCTEPRAM